MHSNRTAIAKFLKYLKAILSRSLSLPLTTNPLEYMLPEMAFADLGAPVATMLRPPSAPNVLAAKG